LVNQEELAQILSLCQRYKKPETKAAPFCVIPGGEYAITGTSGADNEQSTGTFQTGKSCAGWKYYNGKCGLNE
jgi:hypothetical protein